MPEIQILRLLENSGRGSLRSHHTSLARDPSAKTFFFNFQSAHTTVSQQSLQFTTIVPTSPDVLTHDLTDASDSPEIQYFGTYQTNILVSFHISYDMCF